MLRMPKPLSYSPVRFALDAFLNILEFLQVLPYSGVELVILFAVVLGASWVLESLVHGKERLSRRTILMGHRHRRIG